MWQIGKRAGLVFTMATLVAAAAVAETRPYSQWVYPGEDGRLVYRATEHGDRILDFSHVGYMGGGVALPAVSVAVTLEPAADPDHDDTPRLQQAIDELSAREPDAQGFRGAILLKAGVYNIHDRLTIRQGGIVIRGQGNSEQGTILQCHGPSGRFSRVFEIGGSGRWRPSTASLQPVVGAVPAGQRRVEVADASGFAVGDQVVVERHVNEQWVHDIGMDRLPPRVGRGESSQWNPRDYIYRYERVIEAIEGNVLVLNVGPADAVRPAYGGGVVYRYTFPGRIEQVGIENLRAVAMYQGTPQEHEAPRREFESHPAMLLDFRAVRHFWVRDVDTYHFTFGLARIGSLAVAGTIQDCRILDPVSQIRGSRRYGISVAGQLILAQRCYANNDRHAFAHSRGMAGPNVFLDCHAQGSIGDHGPHMGWAAGALMDNVRVPDHSIRVVNRLISGNGHGWAGVNFVIWNSQAGHLMLHSPPIGTNWAIGNIGEIRQPSYANPATYQQYVKDSYLAEHGSDPLPQWGYGPDDDRVWDSHGVPVWPASLYLYQLHQRLGADAIRQINQRPYSFQNELDAWLND